MLGQNFLPVKITFGGYYTFLQEFNSRKNV